MVKGFNTGRCYTKFGQRISWLWLSGEDTVLFQDHDRCIYGRLEGSYESDPGPRGVLQAYDAGSYRWDGRASHVDAGIWEKL